VSDLRRGRAGQGPTAAMAWAGHIGFRELGSQPRSPHLLVLIHLEHNLGEVITLVGVVQQGVALGAAESERAGSGMG
jgi:hypothetical protein